MNPVLKKFENKECLVIAEIAQAHDGSLGTAHAYIDAVAKAGADAIKFQTHIAEAESTALEQWRVKFSFQDDTRFDYWKRMEFTEEQWSGLKDHAEERGLIFISSPFSMEAVDLLERLNMQVWKIASGEITNYPMMEQIFKTKKPILISSGMSPLNELDELVNRINKNSLAFGVLQCSSTYPTLPEKVGINMLEEFSKRYNCPVGISDHSGTIFPGLAGVALGMDILELHVTFSKEMFGPDVVASITIEELKQLTTGIRFIERMKKNPIEKNKAAVGMQPLRDLFTKSIVAKYDLEEGVIIEEEHLSYKKPGTGLPASRYLEFIGKRLNKSVKYNHFFSTEDFS